MTTKTKTETREPKAINIKPAKQAEKVQLNTKVAALIEVLSKPGGATLQQCAEVLSLKGSSVDDAMAKGKVETRRWSKLAEWMT